MKQLKKMQEDKQVLIGTSSDNPIDMDEYPVSEYVEVPLSYPHCMTSASSNWNVLNGNTATTTSTSSPISSYDQLPYVPYENNIKTFRPCSDPLPPPSPSQALPRSSGDENGITGLKNIRNNFLCRRLFRISRYFSAFGQLCRFHSKLLLSSFLVMISSSGCLIFFPLHLENISTAGNSDGYSACISASTVTTLLFLFNCLVLEFQSRESFSDSVLRPLISWRNVLKVGVCLGLSLLTIFYAWEDDKVPCNFQDPLLGLVIIFAIITHAVCRWKSVGLKRTFALSAIAAGVFVSVDYPLVDHHRCRGYYYRNQPGGQWTWKVHLVWTLAFVVSIWLSTVAAFFLESSVPVPKVKHSRLYDLEYNAVKLKVIKDPTRRDNNSEEISSNNNGDSLSFPHVLKSYRFNPYVNFHFGLIANAVLWFSVATWFIIASFFWTEFIPGFGKGVNAERLPERLLMGFRISLTTGSSWLLFISLFVFSHSFTYLIVLTRSPIVAISVAMIAFPIIGLWWSFFQIRHSLFVWMPVFSGELISAFLGLSLVVGGCYYLLKYEILNPAKVKNTRSSTSRTHPHLPLR